MEGTKQGIGMGTPNMGVIKSPWTFSDMYKLLIFCTYIEYKLRIQVIIYSLLIIGLRPLIG